VAGDAIRLLEDSVELIPVRHRRATQARIEDLRTALAQAVDPQPTSKLAAFWKTYRDEMKFHLIGYADKHHKGTIIDERDIVGTDDLLAFTGWKPSTLSQRMSLGRGVAYINKDAPDFSRDDDRTIYYVITRLPR
jgi:hypothetical protein